MAHILLTSILVMKHVFSILLVLSFIWTAGGSLLAESNYSNPVFLHDWPDPTFWRGSNGVFYSFSTAGTKYNDGRGKILSSFDLVQWDSISEVVFSQQTVVRLHEIGRELWAPHVTQVNGQWLMYLTCYNSAQQTSIVVLSLRSKTFPRTNGCCGPWELVSTLTNSTETGIYDTIDPFVITDPTTRQVWLFFGSTNGIYRVELAPDGMSLAPDAKYIHIAGRTIGEDPSRHQVFESAYLYPHEGYWYLFVSSGLYSNDTYDIKVGRSQSLTGPFYDAKGHDMVDGAAQPLLSTPNDQGVYWGPGGLGGIVTDDQGRTFALYHCHTTAVPATVSSYVPRPLMLEPLYWDKKTGWPYFKSSEPQASSSYPDLSQSVSLPQIQACSRQVEGYYSLYGLRIDHAPQATCIVRYTDGSIEKIIRKQ